MGNRVIWRANIIAFVSSFCVMVIELIAARLLAPYIGVSLYTWTSIIGVILGGIALGNYLGGSLADRYPSPLVLVAVFLLGALATVAILPATKLVTSANWFSSLPVMLDFTVKTLCIFFLPALILSMVSPLVIKLALADLGQTGCTVGTIYACSTVGAILGTFMTGFFFILWFGIRTIVWLDGGLLVLMGVLSWFAWRLPGRWRLSRRNLLLWAGVFLVVLAFLLLYRSRESWEVSFTRESNYYSIRVHDEGNVKVLSLDHLVHSYVIPDDPIFLKYDYLKIFAELIGYLTRDNPAPRVLHLGGGGYSLPRYLDTVYPRSTNEVVEIDPAVTRVAYEELGLPYDTRIKTYNQDARLFLIQMPPGEKYQFAVGDVFNDFSTPYHLTTREFAKLLKSHMTEGGIYMVNIIDSYSQGRYMPSFLYTLRQVFRYVYLFSPVKSWENAGKGTFVIAATDRPLDLEDFRKFISKGSSPTANPHDEAGLEKYLAERKPLLLTDDYTPTDILIAPLMR